MKQFSAPNWTRWPKDSGLGYSFDDGDRKADVGRRLNSETGLIEWYVKTWKGNMVADARTTFTGQDLYAAVGVVASQEMGT